MGQVQSPVSVNGMFIPGPLPFRVGSTLHAMSTRDSLSSELLDALDEHAIVSVADLDGRIIYVNDKFCAVSGYGRDDLIGENHRILKSGDHDAAFYEQLWATISGGRVWHGELANRKKGGERYWVSSTIVPVLDPQGLPERYVSIRTDITSQKLLERQAREQEEFLGDVTDALGEGVLVADAKGQCVFASQEALQLLRRRLDEAIGHPLVNLLAVVPGSITAMSGAKALAEPLVSPWREGRYNAEFTRSDGRRLKVAMHLSPLKTGKFRNGAVVAFHDNAGDRRVREEAIRMSALAEQSNRAKSAFLANLSHEIRTPLNGVLGLVRLARDEPLASPEIPKYLSMLEDSAQALASLVSDVLDLSKIEAGKLSLESVAFDVRELARSVWEGYAELARQGQVSLNLEVADDVPRFVLGDPMRVRQVIVNYLANALKFTSNGSIRIRVDRHIRRERRRKWDALRFEVADTGIGLDPAVIPELFRPFQQGDSSTTRLFGGSGLGLSICRELALQMGGQVGAENRPGGGAVFWFEFPLHEVEAPEAPAQASVPSSEAFDLRGLRALVVEDNEVNQLIARSTLERWGCLVTVIDNGEAAVRAVDEQAPPFDIVIMDLQMPVMGGREATQLIRQRHSANVLPIVALTAAALPEERLDCLAMGMNDYLTKPIDANNLRAVIGRLCGKDVELKTTR